MKTLVLRQSVALDALRALAPTLLLFAAAALGTFALSHPNGQLILITTLALGTAAAAIAILSPGKLFALYVGYLMFEGGFKILSNYNVVLRFGSDFLLGLAFLKLMGRHQREGNPDLHPDVRRRFGTLVGFFTLFWIWVAIQFANPWGLGLVPSLAGMKVYLVPLLVFFAAGIYMRDTELRVIPYLMLLLGLFQASISLIDWWQGPLGLPMLHPKYAQVLWEFLQGFPYRPFGTTNLPGAPALWMFHCLAGSLLLLAQLKKSESTQARGWRTAFVVFIPLALFTLIACQGRLSLLRFLGLLLGGLFLLNKKQAVIASAIVGAAVLGALSLTEMNYQDALTKKSFVKVEDRLQLALSRLATLQSQDEWVNARGGDWAVNQFFSRGKLTASGIGLSRVGAASAPWASRIATDRYFNAEWTFTDNLALALFTELGVGGLIGYVLLVLAVLVKLLGVGSIQASISFWTCALLFFSGWGSEGILFQPDASMFWLTAALGLRSPRRGVIEI